MNPQHKWLQRRSFLIGLSAAVAAGTLSLPKRLNASIELEIAEVEDSLRAKAAAKGLIYGANPEGGMMAFKSDRDFREQFLQECGLVVGPFAFVANFPQRDRFDFTETDYFYQVARENNLIYHGGGLVWHDLLPDWLIAKFQDTQTTAKDIETILTQYISTVVGRYAGKLKSWVIVNEAIGVSDGRADGLRDTLVSGNLSGVKYPTWLHFLGPAYIDLAFRIAAQADPNLTLVYNEYGLDFDTPAQEAKRTATLKLLERLVAQGTPVGALGMQSHLLGDETRLNPTKLRNFLKNVADLGLKIIISELDVADRDLAADVEQRDRQVARMYGEFLSVVLDEPAVSTVITWGLSDRYTWLSWYYPRLDGLPVRPLPLDSQLKRKKAWSAIANAFEATSKR